MYNGVGLISPRGSGTNGCVQRNLATTHKSKDKDNTFKAVHEIIPPSSRKLNAEIIEHDKKRKIEIKCLEFQQMLENQGYTEEDATKRVNALRLSLCNDDTIVSCNDPEVHVKVKETYEIAEAREIKNTKLRQALGISDYSIDETSFSPEGRRKLPTSNVATKEIKKFACDAVKKKKKK